MIASKRKEQNKYTMVLVFVVGRIANSQERKIK